MADQIAVVTFTSRGTPGTQDITDPSITESFSAAIFLVGGLSDDSDLQHAAIGIGFCAPDSGATTEETCMSAVCEDGITTQPDSGTMHSTGSGSDCIRVANPTSITATELVRAQYSASISGGVRINFVTTTVQVRITAILFAGLTRAYTDDCTATTIGASESVGGTTDFEPDAVLFVASDSTINADKQDATPNIGFAVNDGESPPTQVCAYVNVADFNEPTDADGILLDDAAFVHQSSTLPRGATLATEQSQVDQFTSTGFDHTSDAGTPDAIYLALKFSDPDLLFTCAQLQVAGTTGVQTFSGLGFAPVLVVGMSTTLTTLGSQVDGAAASCSSYFVTGDYGDRGYTWHHEEGLTLTTGTASNAGSRSEDAIVQYTHTGGIAMRATWVGATADGFQLDFTTATSGYLTVLALGYPLPPTVLSETVGISDSTVAFLSQSIALSEGVTISESVVSDTMNVSVTEGAKGVLFSAGADRGSFLSHGAEAGVIT